MVTPKTMEYCFGSCLSNISTKNNYPKQYSILFRSLQKRCAKNTSSSRCAGWVFLFGAIVRVQKVRWLQNTVSNVICFVCGAVKRVYNLKKWFLRESQLQEFWDNFHRCRFLWKLHKNDSKGGCRVVPKVLGVVVKLRSPFFW